MCRIYKTHGSIYFLCCQQEFHTSRMDMHLSLTQITIQTMLLNIMWLIIESERHPLVTRMKRSELLLIGFFFRDFMGETKTLTRFNNSHFVLDMVPMSSR